MRKFWLFAAIAVTAASPLCRRVRAQSLTFSTDFDGRGTGGSFTITVSPPPTPYARQGPYFPPHPVVARDTAAEDYARYLAEQYREQKQEAERAAREAEIERKAEEARRRSDMLAAQKLLEEEQQLTAGEPNYQQRMRDIQQVLGLEQDFARKERDYLDMLPSYRDRLAESLNHINVPPPDHPQHYQRILIWGTFNTPEEAAAATRSGQKDPFTGAGFDEVFAFGTSGPSDLLRVVLDNLLSSFNTLSPQTQDQIARLKGAEADELVCHSNGCTVAEILIATGMLKVHTLRMLGADSGLFEVQWLNRLAADKGLNEISLYNIKGDPIPMVNPGWEIMDLMRQVGHPLESLHNKWNDPLYQMLGMAQRDSWNQQAKVQIHTLTYPAAPATDPLDKHFYTTYDRVITGWRMSGCLAGGGQTNPHCMIY